ncbi:hypothetical protein [Streptomyces sp. NPDC055749]
MDVNDVADQLYGLRPEEFTAARNEQAAAVKKDGDRVLAGQISNLCASSAFLVGVGQQPSGP